MKLSENHRYHVIDHAGALESYASIGKELALPEYLTEAFARCAREEDEATKQRTMRVILTVSDCLASAAVRNQNENEVKEAKGSDPSLN